MVISFGSFSGSGERTGPSFSSFFAKSSMYYLTPRFTGTLTPGPLKHFCHFFVPCICTSPFSVARGSPVQLQIFPHSIPHSFNGRHLTPPGRPGQMASPFPGESPELVPIFPVCRVSTMVFFSFQIVWYPFVLVVSFPSSFNRLSGGIADFRWTFLLTPPFPFLTSGRVSCLCFTKTFNAPLPPLSSFCPVRVAVGVILSRGFHRCFIPS